MRGCRCWGGGVSRQGDPPVFAGGRGDGAGGLETLHARFPGARQLVYEWRQSLPITCPPSRDIQRVAEVLCRSA